MFTAKFKNWYAALSLLQNTHALLGNYFNPEHHPYSRLNFKLNCAATLAEWRQLLSASIQIASAF